MKNIALTIALLFLGSAINYAQSDLEFFDNPASYKGHRTSVGDIDFSPDGKLLATCGGKNQIIVFSVPGGEIKMSSPENTSRKPMNFLSFSPNGKEVAVCGYTDDEIEIWDITTGKIARKVGKHSGFSDINYSPDGKYLLAVGSKEGTRKQSIVLWNAITGEKVRKLFQEESDKTFPTTAVFSPDGKYVACGISNVNHGLRIWETETGTLVRTIPHKTDVSHVVYSPDGKYIAGGGIDKSVNIWDASTGKLIRAMAGHDGYVTAVAYSPDGKHIVSTAMHNDCKFKLWDAGTGKLVQSMGKRSADINEARFSPDGQTLAISLQTYGDAFDVSTVLVYNTAKAVETAEWHVFESNAASLRMEFPIKPTYTAERKGSYTYHKIKLTHSYQVYDMYVEQYHIAMTDSKRDAAEVKMANFYKSGAEVIRESTFSYNGQKGIDMVVQKGTSRYAYRIIFLGDKLYRASFGSRNKGDTPEETRFLQSLSLPGGGSSSSSTTSTTNTATTTSTASWRKHSSGKGYYNITFPGKPVLDTKVNGNGNISYTASIRVANQDYIVVATDFSATMKGKQLSRYITKSAENYIKVTKAKVTSKKVFSVNGQKGYDYVLDKPGQRYRYRVVAKGDFIYWVIYTARTDKESNNEVKFINSLQLR
jgi:WD40 repeat protein